MLLSEVWRWTDDAAFVRELKEPALRRAALDRRVRRPRRRRLRRVRAAHRRAGSRTSRGRTRTTRSASTTGRSPRRRSRRVEVQGYVYDAKLRTAELAREVWRDRAARRAARARGGGAAARASTSAFWTDARGGYYVLALDGEKRQVDSLCSNIGHLLWSGIVPSGRVDAVVDQLMGAELWSGWGVRTMSSGDAGYNPLSYHNGTVWPHDNSLIAHGLALHDRWPEAQRIVRRMLERRLALRLPAARGLRRACRAPRRRSRSPTRPRRARRRGRPGRRCCCCRSCSASSPTGAAASSSPRARGAALVGRPLAAPDRDPRLRPRLGRARRARARHR